MKRSPKGLFEFERVPSNQLAKRSVEDFIESAEAWARTILSDADIETTPTNALKLADKRTDADVAHWALLVIHKAARLRHSLSIAASKGADAEFQAIWAADRMVQLSGAAFSGLFVQLERAIWAGLGTQKGGAKGGAITRKVTPEKEAKIRSEFDRLRKDRLDKMLAYARIAARERVSISTVQNVIRKK